MQKQNENKKSVIKSIRYYSLINLIINLLIKIKQIIIAFACGL